MLSLQSYKREWENKMQYFYRDVVAFFHDMATFQKVILIITLFMIGISFLRIVIKLHYNAKKFSIKIVPIILMILFFSFAIFIACC